MTTQTRKTDAVKGIFFMLAAMWIFMTSSAVAKETMGRFPLIQVIFFRNFFALIPCLYLLKMAGGIQCLKTTQWKRYPILAITGFLSFVGLFMSLKLMHLADAVTIHFSETLFITVLAALILKEKVGLPRWAAVTVGFIGVIIMMRPTGDVLNMGALFALLFALGDSFFMINTRILSKTQASSSIVTYYASGISLLCLITFAFLPEQWITPTNMMDWGILIFLGLSGGLGQICVAQSYRHAPASIVSPMIFTALLWSVFYGYVFWGDIPDMTLLFGASLIVSAGLYVIYRETHLAKSAKS